MAVKVTRSNGEVIKHETGTDAGVIDGHLKVTAAWDPEGQGFPTVAWYAPGQWRSVVVAAD